MSSRNRDRTPTGNRTGKNWLRAQDPSPTSPPSRPSWTAFTSYYNHQRPHRSCRTRLPRRRVCRPAKAASGDRTTDAHNRVRTDRIDATVNSSAN